MWTSWIAACSLAAAVTYPSLAGAAADTTDVHDARAQAIVDKFTTMQLLGQMTQVDINTVMNVTTQTLNETAVRAYAKQQVGSYISSFYSSRRGDKYGWTATEFRGVIKRIQEIAMEENDGHPIIYGIDSVHGATYVDGAVMFPHQINMGASFNPDLVYRAARIAARDTAAAGISMILGPILEISYNPLWARTFETFSEDPYVTSMMGDAVVRGLQSYNHTAACVKHFLGYSKTDKGHDREGVTLSDFDLLNYYMPPFKAAINAGAMAMIETYASINGQPVVASSRILDDLLRSDLGFDGVLVTDWAEINNLKDWHRVAKTYEDAVALSLTHTSIDMSMVPSNANFIGHAQKMLEKHPEQEARLRASVKRIVKTKLKLGLYENPVPGEEYTSMVGNDDDVHVALTMARESIVLLKNADNVLPLPKKASVFLTGHSADNVGYQCGGLSKSWQGYSGNMMFPHGVSVRQGFEGLVGNSSFTYFNGLQVNGSISDADLATAVKHASEHQYTVAVIGEANYAEKRGDIDNLELPAGQVRYIEALRATNTTVIVVLFGGRPRLLGSIPANSMAIINGMLACELGGQAMAEIIYGEVNPSGRMPITYPKDPANVAIAYNHLVTTRCASDNCRMEFEFGAGLSYTQFNYSGLSLDTTRLTSASATVTAKVTVANTGNRAGNETVMLFVIQPFRSISVPEMKLLKKFKKIELQAGESMDVSFTLTTDDVSVYDPQIGKGLKRVFEDSDYVVAIKPDTWCDVYNNITNPLCAQFSIDTSGAAAATPVQTIVDGAPVATSTRSAPVATSTGSAPVETIVETLPVATSGDAAPVTSSNGPAPAQNIAAAGPVTASSEVVSVITGGLLV